MSLPHERLICRVAKAGGDALVGVGAQVAILIGAERDEALALVRAAIAKEPKRRRRELKLRELDEALEIRLVCEYLSGPLLAQAADAERVRAVLGGRFIYMQPADELEAITARARAFLVIELGPGAA